MVSYVLLALFAVVGLYLGNKLRRWRYYYLEAKKTGLPIIVVPIFVFTLWWIILERFAKDLLLSRPRKSRPRWLDYARPNHFWQLQYASFEDFEHDTYMCVSPGGNMLFTANAEVIAQVTTRRADFPKPTWMYRNVEVYGHNVVSSEGQEWRRQRKVTSPPFTEKNNQLVWAESMRQAQLALRKWTGGHEGEGRTFTTLAADATRITLNVISQAAFGIRIGWPGVEAGSHEQVAHASDKVASGQRLSFAEALESLSKNVVLAVALGPSRLSAHPLFSVIKH